MQKHHHFQLRKGRKGVIIKCHLDVINDPDLGGETPPPFYTVFTFTTPDYVPF